MIHKQSAGGVIVNELNEVAIVFNDTKSWQFPKGTVEKGESFLQTAIREIEEETALMNVTFIEELPIYTRIRDNISRDIHYFLCRVKKQELKPCAEISACEWISIDKVYDKLTYKEDKEFFKKIKSKLSNLDL